MNRTDLELMLEEELRRDPAANLDYVHREARRSPLVRGGYTVPLLPRIIGLPELERLQRCASAFVQAIGQIPGRVFGGDIERIAAFLHLPRLREPCLAAYSLADARWTLARPDAYVWDGAVQFLEQNISSGIGGYGFSDDLTAFYLGLPAFAAIAPHLEPMPVMDAIAEHFADEFPDKTVGFLDAVKPGTDEPYDPQGHQIVSRMSELGVPVRYLDLAEIEYRDALRYRGEVVDVVFRNFPIDETWERLERLLPILRACADGRAIMVDSPLEPCVENKQLLAFLSDPDLMARAGWTSAEAALFAECVPWTRLLRGDRFERDGGHVDRAWLQERRDQLVLKKGRSYQGRDVCVGATVDPDGWACALDRGLQEGDWLVQQLVKPPVTRLPFAFDDHIRVAEVHQMSSPFLIDGRVVGVMCRNSIPGKGAVLSAGDGINATAGLSTAFFMEGELK